MNRSGRALLCGMVALWAGAAGAQEPRESRAPMLHMLVIGVNDYASYGSRLNSLQGAVSDARTIGKAFSAKFGGRVRLHELLDTAATWPAISRVVQQINRTAHKDDLFVFFFSGHGMADSSAALLLLPGPGELNGISAKDLRTWLNVMPAGNQLVILDAAFSGDFFRAFQALDLNQRAQEAGTLIANLASITVDGIAWEVQTEDGGKAGALTSALTAALEDAESASMFTLSSSLGGIFEYGRGKTCPDRITLDCHESGPLLIHHAGSDFPLTAAGLLEIAGASAADRPPPTVAAIRSDQELSVDSTATTVALAVRVGALPAGSTIHINGRLATVAGQNARVTLRLADVGSQLLVRVTSPGMRPRESAIAFSAFRGFEIAAPARAVATSAASLRPRSVAVLFATNEYDNERNLRNPVFDAEAIGAELSGHYGFEVHLIRNATREQMRDSLHFYATRADAGNDQLLVFFAGHGSYDQSRIMDGYVVARDTKKTGDDPYRDTAVQYSWVRRLLANASSRHVLLMLDVCYGGSFIDRVSESASRETEDDPMYRSADLATHMERTGPRKTRQYLTAGGIERVPDGRPGEHSPFARRFLEALRTYGGSRGFLTLKDLHATIQTVSPEPRAGGFELDEPGSDFVFVARR